MKNFILFALIVVFTFGATKVFAAKSNTETKKENPVLPVKSENKLSEEELSRLRKRVEEIRDMDKTNLTGTEKRELKKEVKGIKKEVRHDGGTIYIGTGTLVLIIILLIVFV